MAAAVFPGSAAFNTMPANGQPVEWSGDDHWFEVISVPGGITWTAANSDAQVDGGYLATITSANEDAFVYSLADYSQFWALYQNNDDGPWLGGTYDLASGGTGPIAGWSWVTGEPWSYTDWYPGEPDHQNYPPYNYPQDSLHFYGGNYVPAPTWDDDWHSNSKTVSYVVEWNSKPTPEPSTLALLAAGAIGPIAYGLRQRRAARRTAQPKA